MKQLNVFYEMILLSDNFLLNVPPGEQISSLEITGDIATIVIAMLNTFLVWLIFVRTRNQGIEDKEQARKIDLLKSLILDHNLKHLYSFFEDVEAIVDKLKDENLSDTQKSLIIEKVNDQFINVRKKFTDSLLAIDPILYTSVLKSTDKLQAELSNNSFDNGINLSHGPKYEECIEKPLQNTRTSILQTLFQYRG